LKEKYVALDRVSGMLFKLIYNNKHFLDYEKAFSAAIKQKILTFMTKNREELTLWQLLDETFSIWKRTNKFVLQQFQWLIFVLEWQFKFLAMRKDRSMLR
jgi:hypothetical protein